MSTNTNTQYDEPIFSTNISPSNPERDVHINYLVTWSNIYAIPLLLYVTISPIINWQLFTLAWLAVLASVLMHLSETKHGLPGVYPFNKFSNEFLWFDRIMAITSSVYLANILYNNWFYVSKFYIIYPIVGLMFNGVSELADKGSLSSPNSGKRKYVFAITHSIWHYFAYTFFFYVISNECFMTSVQLIC